jgi:hypothetical protein
MTVALPSRKSRGAAHSREKLALSLRKDGNPALHVQACRPAYARVARPAIFISLGGPQPLGHPVVTSHNFLQRAG